jgi:hypothetical protein
MTKRRNTRFEEIKDEIEPIVNGVGNISEFKLQIDEILSKTASDDHRLEAIKILLENKVSDMQKLTDYLKQCVDRLHTMIQYPDEN